MLAGCPDDHIALRPVADSSTAGESSPRYRSPHLRVAAHLPQPRHGDWIDTVRSSTVARLWNPSVQAVSASVRPMVGRRLPWLPSERPTCPRLSPPQLGETGRCHRRLADSPTLLEPALRRAALASRKWEGSLTDGTGRMRRCSAMRALRTVFYDDTSNESSASIKSGVT